MNTLDLWAMVLVKLAPTAIIVIVGTVVIDFLLQRFGKGVDNGRSDQR